MSYPEELDGPSVYNWARRAVDALRARRADINALNVFPVPDSDTGSNMAYTMESALAEADKLIHAPLADAAKADAAKAVAARADAAKADATWADNGEQNTNAPASVDAPSADATSAHALSAEAIAQALSAGAIRGARGNSGVVLSQVLRGLADAAAHGPLDAHAIAQALSRASRMVDEAINEPVEGTVITVLRTTATAAQHALDTDPDLPLVDLVRLSTGQARRALSLTPSQLPTLRAAGVVDAGGQGFVFLLDALLDEIEQRPAATLHELTLPASGGGESAEDTVGRGADFSGAGAVHAVGLHRGDNPKNDQYVEIMCFLEGKTPAVIAKAREVLHTLGDSVIVAPADDTACTVHVHVPVASAGPAIMALVDLGDISDLRLEVLPPAPVIEGPPRILVAVVPEGPLREVYQQAQALTIDGAGVAAELSAVQARTGAQEIILLPNGLVQRSHLVSAELTAHATATQLSIVHTEHLVAGLAAVAVHDPTQPLAVDTFAMSEAAAAVRTAHVQPAAHAGLSTAHAWAAGDFVATTGSTVRAAADTARQCVARAAVELLGDDGELLTVLLQSKYAKELTPELLRDELRRAGCSRAENIDISCFDADGMSADIEIGVE